MADDEKYKVRMQGALGKSFDICFVSGAEHYYLCFGSLQDWWQEMEYLSVFLD